MFVKNSHTFLNLYTQLVVVCYTHWYKYINLKLIKLKINIILYSLNLFWCYLMKEKINRFFEISFDNNSN